MSEFDEFDAAFCSPSDMVLFGDCGALQLTTADGSKKETYDAILGQIRETEEPRGTGNIADLEELVSVQRQTVSVIPKESQLEINDSCKAQVRQYGSEEFESWLIEQITSSTPAMITMELRRPRRKRGPESRQQR